MQASEVLQKCLSDGFAGMHVWRARALSRAVEALLAGRRLTMMDLARAWPGATRVRAPLKALDRLLSNGWLHAEQDDLYRAMAEWLLRSRVPVIVVDWSDLKADGSWHVLRAAIPVGGRALPILDMVFPGSKQGSPKAQRQFLERLKTILPEGCCPVLITDAGFKAPWFRAVSELGWRWLGRMRGCVCLQPEADDAWVRCQTLYPQARAQARDLGLIETVRRQPWTCRAILYAKPAQGRKHRNHYGRPARSQSSRENAKREREPWLLVASPELELDAHRIVQLYARRMQIELSFRDLKSHRYGQGFEDSLTRKPRRIEVLLLLNALATFASWLVGLACRVVGLDRWLAPRASRRALYSTIRLGREALARGWMTFTRHKLLALVERCLSPPSSWEACT